MLNSTDIEAQLKNVPKDKCVAFAVRAAMRLLPLLAIPKTGASDFSEKSKEAFWFWRKDKDRHLLALFRAYIAAVSYVIDKNAPASNAANAAVLASNAADAAALASNAATRAAYAAYATAYAAAAANDDLPARAAAAAYVAVTIMQQPIHADLTALKTSTASELLKQPLWPTGISPFWQQRYQDFIDQAKSLNARFEVWLTWYDDRVTGKPVDKDILRLLNNTSKELEAQGITKLNAHLANLIQNNDADADAAQPLNRVRAIFIGYGEAGKTSLIRALHGEEVLEGKEAVTAGIDIRDWQVPDTDIQAHFWDFGGQVVFHSTHKFFLRSSCVYVVVINARADINNSEQAEYWLEHVKVFGGSAPILIVGNKADEAQIHLQMQTLSQKYPNIKGFYPLSCTHAKTSHQHQFEHFKLALTQELQAVGMHQMLFTPAQANILEELRNYSPDHAFLSEQEFHAICDKHGISNEGELNRDWLVNIFDKLGVMLHFEELKTFHDAYLLNPRWLTHGVYTLMNAKQARLNEQDMVNILKAAPVKDEYQHLLSYPSDKCLFISQAMQRFRLCYTLPNGANSLLIPALLCDELPRYPPELQNEKTLRFEFAFNGFLPRNLIGEFMVSRHEEIKGDLQSQRGAVFVSKTLQAEALVEADYHRRLLVMQVYERDAKDYLMILYDAMIAVFGELNLDYREWVDLPRSACIDNVGLRFEHKFEKAPYQQLLANAKKGQTVYIAESGLSYNLAKVFGLIISEARLKSFGIQIDKFIYGNVTGNNAMTTISQNVTGSTIHGSVLAAEKIENCLNTLQSSPADNDIKQLLSELLKHIAELNSKVPAEVLDPISRDAEDLVNEVNSDNPRKRNSLFSLEGIKDAAIALGETARPIIEIAEKISPYLENL